MIETIFFDLDDTLLDFHAAEHRAISATLSHFGVTPSEDMCRLYSACNIRQWKRLERGEIDRAQVKSGRFADFFGQIGLAVDPTEATAFYEETLSHGAFFVPYAKPLLDSLYGSYRLFIVTNGTARVQEGRLADSGILPRFEDVFISEHIGFDKPSIEFFNACFARIPHFSKERALLVGDSLTSDICGGNRAGLHTVWFDPNNTPLPTEREWIPEYRITELQELPPLLKTL